MILRLIHTIQWLRNFLSDTRGEKEMKAKKARGYMTQYETGNPVFKSDQKSRSRTTSIAVVSVEIKVVFRFFTTTSKQRRQADEGINDTGSRLTLSLCTRVIAFNTNMAQIMTEDKI